MNQGKLEVVKQEMARVNVDILGISELKWTGMGVFNSDDHVRLPISKLLCKVGRPEVLKLNFQGPKDKLDVKKLQGRYEEHLTLEGIQG